MSMKLRRQSWKRMIRRAKRARSGGVIVVAVLLVFAAGIIIERNTMKVNYTELLSTIAEGESKGNYNAYFGHANNSSVVFTDMTVADVMQWQRDFVANGQPSNAVGKYQFMGTTLAGLVSEMGIDPQTKFDEALQDKLAVRLIERRGVRDYLRGAISREQFAHNLSMEWAALPRVVGGDPNASYYAGDGLNKSHISINAVLGAIDTLRDKPQV